MTVNDSLSQEDVKFFKKRASSLKSFAGVDLEKEAPGGGKWKGSKKSLKKKQKRDPVGFDALERAEDEVATRNRKMQAEMERDLMNNSSGDDCDSEGDVDEYERRAMKAISKREERKETVSERVSLPIRSQAGQWKSNVIEVVKKAEKATEAKEDDVKESASTESVKATDSKVDKTSTSSKPQKSLDEAKEELALLAMEITEELEDNLNRLKELLTYTRPREDVAGGPEASKELMQSGLITMLAVLKDILPGYYIRPLTEAEKAVVVSKEVKRVRTFDEAILKAYTGFLGRLEEILKTIRKGDAALVPIAVACLGQMAEFAGHFNHFDRVQAALCAQIFKEDVGIVALRAIERVWEEDEIGRSTSSMLRMISDAVHDRGYLNLPNTDLLEALLKVRLKVLMFARDDKLPSEKQTIQLEAAKMHSYKSKAGHLSKSKRKALRAELEETVKTAQAEAEFTREERAKWSADAAKFLFRILFGCMKACESELNGKNLNKVVMLLPAVLKALARFSQLLSIEFFADLLATLKKIISSSAKDAFTLLTALHTIQTVIQINQLQETAPSAKGMPPVDLKFYFDLLYAQLTRIPREIDVWTRDFEEVFESCMSKLFVSKRHVVAERVAAFAHRLAAVAARVEDSKGAFYLLRLILRLLERHEKARAVLDSEVLGVAAYRPECPDPDMCNPFCLQLDLDALVKRIQQRHGNIPQDLQSYIRKIKKLSLDHF